MPKRVGKRAATPCLGNYKSKVSVAMITYHRERFIAQRIERVLMQRPDFPVELFLREECSTDPIR